MDDEAFACFPSVYTGHFRPPSVALVRSATSYTLHRAFSRSPSFLPWGSSCDVATRARSSRRIVSRKIGGLQTCGGDRVNREQERPSARRYARACLRNSTAVTCGKCDTMRRSQKPGRIKGSRFTGKLRGARDRFPSLPPRETENNRVVVGNIDDITFRRETKPRKCSSDTFFKRHARGVVDCYTSDVADLRHVMRELAIRYSRGLFAVGQSRSSSSDFISTN